jgi:phosphinothricin acetyltransferase
MRADRRPTVDNSIRTAQAVDAAAIAAIYNESIAERQATFETRLRAADEFRAAVDPPRFPFLVGLSSDRVVGWARLSPYSTRECYAGVGEASIYVARAARRRGLGRRLALELIERAEVQGYWKIVGLLFASNHASSALCQSAGFRAVGILRRHGQLDGRWRDVVMVERLLGAAARPVASS